jgi:UDP-N-acetyl-D-glucosamine dehydrogenase
MTNPMPSLATDLIAKLNARTALVGIIGLGYVGLPLARTFCAAGYLVIGFDIDQAKVERLHAGESYLKHIPAEDENDACPAVPGNE